MSDRASAVVIGGGATGTGVARDLALRGVDVTLLERGTLAAGTSGRMHGLLHSGARYAVSDPDSAEECIAENRVLRSIADHAVRETGGLFAKRPEDTAEYFQRKLGACRDCSIPAETLSGSEARELEPALSRDVERAIRVPDAVVDPFQLCVSNALDARERGARIEAGTAVTDLVVEDDRVVGVAVEREGATERVGADHVVNATGAWAGRVAAMADADVSLDLAKGAMVTVDAALDTVLNRCRPRDDADIVVPYGSTSVLGTTNEAVVDPEAFTRDRQEVEFVVEELSKLAPRLGGAERLRSYWGVRPLYVPPGGTQDPTDATRDHFVLDHRERDDLEGFTSVVGGKLTTYRLMAEDVADLVADRLGVSTECSTADRPLPGSEDPDRVREGMRQYGLRSPFEHPSVDRPGD